MPRWIAAAALAWLAPLPPASSAGQKPLTVCELMAAPLTHNNKTVTVRAAWSQNFEYSTLEPHDETCEAKDVSLMVEWRDGAPRRPAPPRLPRGTTPKDFTDILVVTMTGQFHYKIPPRGPAPMSAYKGFGLNGEFRAKILYTAFAGQEWISFAELLKRRRSKAP